jgi:hypothetical protein
VLQKLDCSTGYKSLTAARVNVLQKLDCSTGYKSLTAARVTKA